MGQDNTTDSTFMELEMSKDSNDFSFIIRQFILPIICFFGLFGNTLAATTFMRRSMRDNSCSVLLTTRSISDNGFILTLFVVWLDFVHIRVVHLNGICQTILFLSYVCGFMSVWCVVFVTVENYVRVCHPTKVQLLCTTKIAIWTVILGFLLAAAMYNFPMWTAGIRYMDKKPFCMTKERFIDIEHALTYLDTVFTLIVPLVVILFFMAMIISSSMEARRRHSRLQLQRLSVVSELRRTVSPHTKVTRLLFVVTVVFLILHTPSHVIRMKVIIQNIIGGDYITSYRDRVLQQLFLVLYYLNFSVNIVVYLICGKNFRTTLRQMFCVQCNVEHPEVFEENREESDVKSRNLITDEDVEGSSV